MVESALWKAGQGPFITGEAGERPSVILLPWGTVGACGDGIKSNKETALHNLTKVWFGLRDAPKTRKWESVLKTGVRGWKGTQTLDCGRCLSEVRDAW